MKLVKRLKEVWRRLRWSANLEDQERAEVVCAGIIELRRLRKENKSLHNELDEYVKVDEGGWE